MSFFVLRLVAVFACERGELADTISISTCGAEGDSHHDWLVLSGELGDFVGEVAVKLGWSAKTWGATRVLKEGLCGAAGGEALEGEAMIASCLELCAVAIAGGRWAGAASTAEGNDVAMEGWVSAGVGDAAWYLEVDLDMSGNCTASLAFQCPALTGSVCPPPRPSPTISISPTSPCSNWPRRGLESFTAAATAATPKPFLLRGEVDWPCPTTPRPLPPACWLLSGPSSSPPSSRLPGG